MTEALYLEDCYLKEFDAKVVKRSDGYVVLDRSAFYPLGGGQPSDTGTIDGVEVSEVRKEKGIVRHFVQGDVGDEVHCVLDWDKRYAYMQMHTAQHLVSAIILDEYSAETVGNQIHAEYSRMDLKPFKPSDDDLEKIRAKFNEKVDAALPVKLYFTTREEMIESVDEARRKLFARIPESVKKVRMVEIVGVDKCPCAGTHIKNTSEIGHLKWKSKENKGSDTTRIVFELVK